MHFDREKTIARASVMKALGNPLRLCIVHHLIELGPMCINEFVDCMAQKQVSISQHMQVLKKAGIVELSRVQNRSYYSCEHELTKQLIKLLFD